MRFKSIATRIVMTVMPFLLISSLVYVVVCYNVSHRNINDSIDAKMMESLNVAHLSVQNELDKNAAVAQSSANFATTLTQRTHDENAFEIFLLTTIPTNPHTVGGGIWYEPYGYRDDLYYFGPYAYMSEGEAHFVAEYESSVNYHDMEWYTSGMNSQGDIVWSGAYYDPVADVSMVTSTQPFYAADGAFVGVATSDMALDVIREIVGKITVGTTGRAFLLGSGGEYIHFVGMQRSVEDHMYEDANPDLAKLGKHLQHSAAGTTSLDLNGERCRVYYTTISEVEWTLGIVIEEQEIGSSTRNQMLLSVAFPLLGLLLSAYALVRVAQNLRHVTEKVNAVAVRAAGGDFDVQIDVKEHDEFGVMEDQLNIMIANMKEMSRQSAERLHLAQEASQAKSGFLSRMSHEIRTPINAIIGMTQIARNATDIEYCKDCLAKVDLASRQLLSLVNDILDMSKIEANKLTLEEKSFDFHGLLDNVTTIAAVKTSEKRQKFNVRVAPEIPKRMVSDELRISQVINNLLSNATKFTPEEGTVDLSFDVDEQTEDHLVMRVTIRDTGIGMTQEEISRLFISFEQADGSISRRFGGTGLGMSISKRILEIMGGRIQARSAPGEGSEFTVFFPVGVAEDIEEENETPLEEMPNLERYRILLTEDIEINREIVIALLEETNVRIDCAENGLEACEAMERAAQDYDLILMDLQMPEMGGLEATRRIRAMENPHCQSIPIVAMTANAFQEDIDECLAVGMNRHIGKPLDIDLLIRTLAQLLIKD